MPSFISLQIALWMVICCVVCKRPVLDVTVGFWNNAGNHTLKFYQSWTVHRETLYTSLDRNLNQIDIVSNERPHPLSERDCNSLLLSVLSTGSLPKRDITLSNNLNYISSEESVRVVIRHKIQRLHEDTLKLYLKNMSVLLINSSTARCNGNETQTILIDVAQLNRASCPVVPSYSRLGHARLTNARGDIYFQVSFPDNTSSLPDQVIKLFPYSSPTVCYLIRINQYIYKYSDTERSQRA